MSTRFLFGIVVVAAALYGRLGLAAESQENELPYGVFSQKGGMLVPGDHSVYVRTNDEWTGFSTFYFGYRHGVNRWFNVALEAGVSGIPHVYLAGLLTHWRLFESADTRWFFGLRTRTGYRYQDSDFSTSTWEPIVGEDYLVLKFNGVYLVADLTLALRFGHGLRHCVYYTVYPRVDINFVDGEDRAVVFISPATVGYEKRFLSNPQWSFAFEMGYAFPVPWGSVEPEKWVNFPSLANVGFYFRW